jgi:hypothetical protein
MNAEDLLLDSMARLNDSLNNDEGDDERLRSARAALLWSTREHAKIPSVGVAHGVLLRLFLDKVTNALELGDSALCLRAARQAKHWAEEQYAKPLPVIEVES